MIEYLFYTGLLQVFNGFTWGMGLTLGFVMLKGFVLGRR